MSLLDYVSQQDTTDSSEEDLSLLSTLQKELSLKISADELSRIFLESPERARNEVVRACKEIFIQKRVVVSDVAVQTNLIQQLLQVVFGYGQIEELMKDDAVSEIMINGPSNIYYEKKGVLYRNSESFEDKEQLRTLIDRLLGPAGRRVDEASPLVSARLPDGYRVNVVLEPIALTGPYVSIRKFSKQLISLEEMVKTGSVDAKLAMLLRWLVQARKNVAVSGGTGSGKTTLLNALSCCIPKQERLITIEDSAELRFQEHPHVLSLEARPKGIEGTGEITIRDLVINALRMRPDRIIVGECRGAEAYDMLAAMNTGHDGSLTTLHSNSAQEALTRLATMVRYAVDFPLDAINAYIASALDVIIQVKRSMSGIRFVSQVVLVGLDLETNCAVTSTLYERPSEKALGVWGDLEAFFSSLLQDQCISEKDVLLWKSL